MPYEMLVKQAYNLIDEIPHEKIEYVIQFLKSTRNLYSPIQEKNSENADKLLKAFDNAEVCVPITWTRDEINAR